MSLVTCPKIKVDCPACRTYLIATRFWVVVICPIIKCLTVLEFSFILFDCVYSSQFSIYFELCTYCNILDMCFGVLWVNWYQFAVALANKVKIGLAFWKLGIFHGVYFDCIKIINLRGYIDRLDTSVNVFVNNLLWFVFHFMLFA